MSLTIYLIVITSLISFAAFSAPQIMEIGILRPYYAIREHRYYQLLTSGFLHANLTHLFVNMLTFYFFGSVMERVMGVPHFAGLYFSSILLSGLPSLIMRKDDPNYATLGASGGVEGVLFGFILLFPFETLYVFFALPMPAILFGVLFVAYSIYESKQDRGQVNHEAHIAGAVTGIVYTLVVIPDAAQRFLTQIGL